MVAYVEILDSEIDPESPGTTSLFTRLRDNPIAIIEGASGAPRATSKIITPGGSDADSPLIDATDMTGAGPGFYDFSSALLTASKAMPWIMKARFNGDVSITGGSTVISSRRAIGNATRDEAIATLFNGLMGQNMPLPVAPGDPGGPGGGGSIGAGGRSTGITPGGTSATTSAAISAINRFWILRKVLLGGQGSPGQSDNTPPASRGGGCLIWMINGDCDFTDATLDASGDDGTSQGDNGAGGAGAGSIIIVCNGTIHNGTFLAKGGAGASSTADGGGGGGGLIALIAAAFTGAQTRTVTGGASGGGSSAAGAAGLDLGNFTLTEEIINSMMLGAVA